MNIFELKIDSAKNLLPKEGTVNYYGKLLSQNEADYYYKILATDIKWRNDEAIIFGKKIITKREVAWYGEKPFEYTYLKTTKLALPWTKKLLELKKIVEKKQVNPLILAC